MGEDSKSEKQRLLSTEQTSHFSVALKKIFLLQSSKGYWGRGKVENKVTYTSQGIQLMQALGVSHDNNNFKKAIRWLEDNIGKVESHWSTRVEIGLKLRDFNKLATDDHINHFLDDLEYDLNHPQEEARLDLFWDVIPTLIAFHPYEKDYEDKRGKVIPHEKLIQRIIEISEDFGGTITVQFQANHTGLVALYLATISDKDWAPEYRKKLYEYRCKMVKWLLANREENASSISWQRGKGITSYVLIDLIGCGLEKEKIKKCIPKIIRFIVPDARGNVKKDKVTTYDTKLHAEPLYVSMLVLRAMTEVLKMDESGIIADIRNKASNYSWFEALVAKFSRTFYYNKKKIPIIICVLLCIFGGISYIFNMEFLASLLITIGVSCLLTYLFQVFDKD